jgi:uncharacterized damage-inducible protein DinB
MESDPRYPIGKYIAPARMTGDIRRAWIDRIATLPGRLREVVHPLNDKQLDTPYREEGWTVRQVVHHLADSHLNSYVRFKWTLTEESPTIKSYDQRRWAELPDTRECPVATSLSLLEALHARWTVLLEQMTEDDYSRTFKHPESGELHTLSRSLGTYAWHGDHHLAQIEALKARRGW